MPGQFVQSHGVRLRIAGSGDGVQESDVGWVFSDVASSLVRSGCGL